MRDIDPREIVRFDNREMTLDQAVIPIASIPRDNGRGYGEAERFGLRIAEEQLR